MFVLGAEKRFASSGMFSEMPLKLLVLISDCKSDLQVVKKYLENLSNCINNNKDVSLPSNHTS